MAPAASADPPPPRSPPSAPRRVRVTAPPTASARATVRPARGAAGRDLDEHTVLGDVYLRGLLREQRRLAGGVLALLGLALGPLPVLFALFPGLASVRVAGLELPWLVLGAAVYPLFIAVGWWYVRGAERTERDFTVLLSDREPGGRERGGRQPGVRWSGGRWSGGRHRQPGGRQPGGWEPEGRETGP